MKLIITSTSRDGQRCEGFTTLRWKVIYERTGKLKYELKRIARVRARALARVRSTSTAPNLWLSFQNPEIWGICITGQRRLCCGQNEKKNGRRRKRRSGRGSETDGLCRCISRRITQKKPSCREQPFHTRLMKREVWDGARGARPAASSFEKCIGLMKDGRKLPSGRMGRLWWKSWTNRTPGPGTDNVGFRHLIILSYSLFWRAWSKCCAVGKKWCVANIQNKNLGKQFFVAWNSIWWIIRVIIRTPSR